MAIRGIRVLVIGKSLPLPKEYVVLHTEHLKGILTSISEFQPDVIVTSGGIPGPLNNAAFDIRKRWIHVDPSSPQDKLVGAIEGCYAFNIWSKHQNQDANPLISVYTAAYNTGDYLNETFRLPKARNGAG